VEQSLGGMRRRKQNNRFCNECQCVGRLFGAGRSLGRRRPANIRLSPGVPRRLRPEYQALLCYSERSEESFPLRTKGRGRTMPSKEENDKRSAVKNLFGQGCRCFAALNMTVAAALRKEEKDKRSAVKNLSTYTSIQILRRSAPQNDILLNCSQTPRQTGISNWRQRGKVEGKDVRGGRSLQS